MTKPAVVPIGGDKGGVGKTTLARTLLDYVVDINHVPDQMRIFDTVNSTDATVSLIDVRARKSIPLPLRTDPSWIRAQVRAAVARSNSCSRWAAV
jgi:hypothetical protein